MIEVTGNLWEYPADVRVITTNGTIRKDGACVMGRGCAREAMLRFPGIEYTLGANIRDFGNLVFLLRHDPKLYSFPVKLNWYEKANIDLIVCSAEALSACLSDTYPDQAITVVLPRPGCGNGRLKWDDVKLVLNPILDDRFHVITFK